MGEWKINWTCCLSPSEHGKTDLATGRGVQPRNIGQARRRRGKEGAQVAVQEVQSLWAWHDDSNLPHGEQVPLSGICWMNSHMYFIKAINEGKELPSSRGKHRKVTS